MVFVRSYLAASTLSSTSNEQSGAGGWRPCCHDLASGTRVPWWKRAEGPNVGAANRDTNQSGSVSGQVRACVSTHFDEILPLTVLLAPAVFLVMFKYPILPMQKGRDPHAAPSSLAK